MNRAGVRGTVARMIFDERFDWLMGLIIIGNTVIIALEAQYSFLPDVDAPVYFDIFENVFLAIYCTELCLRLMASVKVPLIVHVPWLEETSTGAHRWIAKRQHIGWTLSALSDGWVVFDMCIVTVGVVTKIVAIAMDQDQIGAAKRKRTPVFPFQINLMPTRGSACDWQAVLSLR